jgi:hypothetical protein
MASTKGSAKHLTFLSDFCELFPIYIELEKTSEHTKSEPNSVLALVDPQH